MQTEHLVIAGFVTLFAAGGLFALWIAYDLAVDLYRKIRDYMDIYL